MRKKLVIIVALLLVLVGWCFRYPLLSQFQYSRLKGLACQEGNADFINDSCLSKIWVHRVNSTARYDILKNRFAGYETDITWDEGRRQFLVYHPPLEAPAIALDSFLLGSNAGNPLRWLDTRGVTAADTAKVLASFNKLDERYKIKLNAIIEVYDTTLANFLADHDYWVALNIQTEWIQKFSRESQWQQLRNAMSPRISFVSQEDAYVPLLKEHFPGKDIITWAIAFKNTINRKHLKDLVTDDKVKVVLVNIKSRYYQ